MFFDIFKGIRFKDIIKYSRIINRGDTKFSIRRQQFVKTLCCRLQIKTFDSFRNNCKWLRIRYSASRISFCISMEISHARCRIREIFIYACHFKSLAVTPGIMHCDAQHQQRLIRAYRIQCLLIISFRPRTVLIIPQTEITLFFRMSFDVFFDAFDHLIEVLFDVKRNTIVVRGTDRVGMRIDQSRHYHSAFGIDYSRIIFYVFFCFFRVTNIYNSVSFDDNARRTGIVIIRTHCINVSILDNNAAHTVSPVTLTIINTFFS